MPAAIPVVELESRPQSGAEPVHITLTPTDAVLREDRSSEREPGTGSRKYAYRISRYCRHPLRYYPTRLRRVVRPFRLYEKR